MRQRPTVSVVTVLALCLLPSIVLAKTKHAPLPDQILQAKTVYIDNRSGVADITDRAYDELTKWGRFKVLSAAKDADLVLLISASAYTAGYNTRSTGTDDGDSVDLESHTTAQIGRITYLTVVDPRSGDALWADSSSGQSVGPTSGGLLSQLLAKDAAANAVRGLIRELRARIAEQTGKGKSN